MSSKIDENMIENAKKLTECLVLNDNTLKKVMKVMISEMTSGLKGNESSSMKMLITYVRSLPNNKEKGKYLALDLGGTNLRVILVDLDSKDAMISDIYKIPEKLMVSNGEALFEYIADCIIKFTEKQKLDTIRMAMGFTFSFPCIQYGLSEAKLVTWTKGFNCSNVVGKDVVKLLKTALKKKSHISNAFVDVVALINDTTGTLMSCAHTNPNCNIGLIVGTGTNSCYIEKLENIEKWPSNYNEPKQVVVNTEWGGFGDNGCIDFIRTEWDSGLDFLSINKGRQKFEKMMSGMYLGEVVRLILLTLIDKKLLFKGNSPKNLTKSQSFHTKYVSKIDSDSEDKGFPKIKQIFDKEFAISYTETDLKIIFLANTRVSRRAANLVAAGCAALIEHMQRQQNTIAFDGSVLKLHPHFQNWVKEKIKQLIEPNINFELMSSEDGSGRGAAIVAAVSYREKRPKIIKRNRKVYEIGTYIHE